MKAILRPALAVAGLCLAASAGAHHTITKSATKATSPSPSATSSTATRVTSSGRTTTLVGRIVDAGCFVSRATSTSQTTDCSGREIAESRPMAFLATTGRLYLLTAPTQNDDAYESCRRAGDSRVQIVGILRERSGIRALEVIELKPTRMASR